MSMIRLNQYLYNKRGRWHYVRRVPSFVAEFDDRGIIRAGLKTSSLDVARHRRDVMMQADDEYWAMLLNIDGDINADTENQIIASKYKSAKHRAMARGYLYTPASSLADTASLDELLRRIADVAKFPNKEMQEAEALLGGADKKYITVSQAFDLYCNKLSIGKLHGKSEAQKLTWKKPKLRAINNFINLFGDLPMDQITRKHGRDFFHWWGERINPADGSKGLNPNSANRDIGNLRTLFRTYWEFEGEEDRSNPFKKLNFTDNVYKDIPAFENDWVRTKILVPGILDGINREAQLITYVLIETGCRPSEISNLRADNIKLDHDVPHIQIRPRIDRQLKSNAASRDIPLIGISLEAMRKAPRGFPHYRDKGNLLSAP